MDYLIAEVRRLTGAGTSEYTIVNQAAATVTYFTDEQIQRVLDSRRVRLARLPINYEEEYSTSGSTVIFQHASVGYKWLEDTTGGGSNTNCNLTDSQGSIIGTANYTLTAEDGFVSFTADQKGSVRFFTGWMHNPYKAAMDILVSWSTELARQPDFQTDNMRVWRSQKAAAVREQIKVLKQMAGLAPQIMMSPMIRDDIDTQDWPPQQIKYDRIP